QKLRQLHLQPRKKLRKHRKRKASTESTFKNFPDQQFLAKLNCLLNLRNASLWLHRVQWVMSGSIERKKESGQRKNQADKLFLMINSKKTIALNRSTGIRGDQVLRLLRVQN